MSTPVVDFLQAGTLLMKVGAFYLIFRLVTAVAAGLLTVHSYFTSKKQLADLIGKLEK